MGSMDAKDLGSRAPEVRAQGLLDGFELEGANPVEALAELEAVALGEEPLARRDELSQLDVGRPELFEGAAHDDGAGASVAAGAHDDGGPEGLEADPRRGQDPAHGARRQDDNERESRDPDQNGQRVSVHRRMIDEPRRKSRQVPAREPAPDRSPQAH